jgi:hypothetical protein
VKKRSPDESENAQEEVGGTKIGYTSANTRKISDAEKFGQKNARR